MLPLWRMTCSRTPIARCGCSGAGSSAPGRAACGPKQSSSVDDVVRAAIAIADAEGLDALSMRKVGDRLGLRVMSVYTGDVANRAELVSLMVDEVAGEEPLKPHRGAIRTRLRRVCQQLYDAYLRHPWLLQAESIRATSGRMSSSATSGSWLRSRGSAWTTSRWTR